MIQRENERWIRKMGKVRDLFERTTEREKRVCVCVIEKKKERKERECVSEKKEREEREREV